MFLIITYFALCSLTYVTENATIGWLIVLSTAIAIAVTMIRAFRTNDVFRLGFAVVGGVWLSSLLGFAVETPTSFKAYNLRTPVWKIMSFGRTSSKIDDYRNLRESTYHDLEESIGMIRLPNSREIPNYHNTMRLVACWSALIAGLIGGTCFSLVMKSNSQFRKT